MKLLCTGMTLPTYENGKVVDPVITIEFRIADGYINHNELDLLKDALVKSLRERKTIDIDQFT